MGYARDFVGAIESVLPAVVERGVRVIANAGGVNPPRVRRRGARGRARSTASRDKVRIGVVTGDDLLPRLDELIASGHALANMETGEPLVDRARSRAVGQRLHRLRRRSSKRSRAARTSSSPAARPTRRSPWRRCATSSAGRATTGIVSPRASSPATSSSAARSAPAATACTTGRTIPDLANVGYPIVEGARRRHVRRHQASEHGRPDLRAVGHRAARVRDGRSALVHHARRRRRLHDDSARAGRRESRARVRHQGTPGDGQAQGVDRVSRRLQGGRHARLLLARCARQGASSPTGCCASGSTASASRSIRSSPSSSASSATHGRSPATPARRCRRCSCASACAATIEAAVERFTREIAPLVLNGPPSVTGFAGGRPKVEEIVAYWPALVDKTRRADAASRCSS